jgi:hypothetical protein
LYSTKPSDIQLLAYSHILIRFDDDLFSVEFFFVCVSVQTGIGDRIGKFKVLVAREKPERDKLDNLRAHITKRSRRWYSWPN